MFKRVFLTGHLDGKLEALAKLQPLIREQRVTGVLYAGSILGQSPASREEKLKKLEEFFSGLGKLGVFTALVPGTTEVPLRDFLRLAREAELVNPLLHVAHATMLRQADVAVCGIGGDLTEEEDRTEDRLVYSRPVAEYFLRTFFLTKEAQHTVLLLSVAPPGPLGGPNGNKIAGDFIHTYHPSLCLLADATERSGVQRIAHTFAVNPGRLSDGSLALLDWKRGKDDPIEFLGL